MNNLRNIMLMVALAGLTACASNEEKMQSAEDSAKETMDAKAESMEADAKAEAEKAEATASEKQQEMLDEAPAAAAEVEEKAEAKVEEIKAEEMNTNSETASDSSSNAALSATCTYGGQERVISVVYDNAETGKACEVNYTKSTGTQTLWSANNERDYCVGKATDFVAKQAGWGWDCSELK